MYRVEKRPKGGNYVLTSNFPEARYSANIGLSLTSYLGNVG